MSDQEDKTGKAKEREVVFVLRLRAGADGWWGQIRKIDDPQPEYVHSTAHLLTLLESHWQAALARTHLHPKAAPEEQIG